VSAAAGAWQEMPQLTSRSFPRDRFDLTEHINSYEKMIIVQALDEAECVGAHAAKRLGMSRTTLVEKMRKFDLAGAKVYESMGGYCPTIGIIGAVLGLIHVVANLADQSALRDGIAAAFVATIYGVGFANLVFLPVGNRLKAIVADRCHWREMVIEGVTSIAQGENPRHIETRLGSYIS
tara:strand:+ start:1324 stop:1860 length:537 start_codon:yes stop_codon:yes gene_type:complete